MNQILSLHRKRVIFTILLSLVASLTLTYASYILTYFGAIFTESSPSPRSLGQLCLYELFVWGIGATIYYLSERYQVNTLIKLRLSLNQLISNSVQTYSYADYEKNGTGKFLSWLTNDVKEINQRSFTSFFELIKNAFQAIGSLVAIFILAVPLGIASILLLLLIMLLPQILNKRLQIFAQDLTSAEEVYTGKIKDQLLGFTLLYTNNRQDLFLRTIREAVRSFEEKNGFYQRFLVLAQFVGMVCSLFAQVILISVAAFSVVFGLAELGALLGAAALAGLFFNSSSAMIRNLMTLKSSKPLWEKYSFKTDKADPSKALCELEKIRCKNLKFRYCERHELLSYPDLEFSYPNKYAVLGANGSGKSTFIKLLAGLYPSYEGLIELNGEDSRLYSRSSVLNEIAYVDQIPQLFSDSIRMNLCLGENFEDDQLWDALSQVGLEKYVRQVPEGLDHILKENGSNLSGGQKQRLVLARVLLRKHRYIFVDEATGQIDEQSAFIIENLLLNRHDAAVIMITHRTDQQRLESFDKIIRL
ncbi:MAG: ABC transporter ATP-binding protein [Eubacteriales bacterium]|nr:ABC transporter ATP-binding protein [Eubacteriales bacterium]